MSALPNHDSDSRVLILNCCIELCFCCQIDFHKINSHIWPLILITKSKRIFPISKPRSTSRFNFEINRVKTRHSPRAENLELTTHFGILSAPSLSGAQSRRRRVPASRRYTRRDTLFGSTKSVAPCSVQEASPGSVYSTEPSPNSVQSATSPGESADVEGRKRGQEGGNRGRGGRKGGREKGRRFVTRRRWLGPSRPVRVAQLTTGRGTPFERAHSTA